MNSNPQKYYSSLYERTPLDMKVIDLTSNTRAQKEVNFLELTETKHNKNVVLLYQRNHSFIRKENKAKNGIMQTI